MADIGIFPSLPGLAWSVIKTPTFQTRIQRAVSGRELRALDYPYPLWQFSLVFDLLRDNPAAGYDELRTLMGFFMLCQGAYATFLFQDPSDHQVTGQQIGVGNASTTVFQLQRAMGATLPGGGFLEPIVAPNVVGAIYLDGIMQNSGTYSVDPHTGLVTFNTPPGGGLNLYRPGSAEAPSGPTYQRGSGWPGPPGGGCQRWSSGTGVALISARC